MSSRVLVELLYGGLSFKWLDVDTGRLDVAEDGVSRGTAWKVGDDVFAVYADAGALWLQWNERRWNFADPELRLMYAHDLGKRTTTFTVNSRSIEYPAWWRDDPHYEPLIPEQDAHWDYLAHVLVVKDDPELQASSLAYRNRQA